MKKILIVSTILLFVLCIVGGVQAVPILVGSFDKGLTPYPAPLDGLTSPYIDTAVNLNILIDNYNGLNDPDLPEIIGPYVEKSAPSDFPDEWKMGTINLTPGYEYLSLKYGNIVDLYYVSGETEFAFNIGKGLSHYRQWNPNPSQTPIPAPILLLGTGLVGIAGFRRKMKR